MKHFLDTLRSLYARMEKKSIKTNYKSKQCQRTKKEENEI
jgi:hypothetical protein